jgi:hypothetical protein
MVLPDLRSRRADHRPADYLRQVSIRFHKSLCFIPVVIVEETASLYILSQKVKVLDVFWRIPSIFYIIFTAIPASCVSGLVAIGAPRAKSSKPKRTTTSFLARPRAVSPVLEEAPPSIKGSKR